MAGHEAEDYQQSRAIGKEGLRIIDELAETFVKSAVDQVSAVATDFDAFVLIVEETETLFRLFRDEVDGLTNVITGNRPRLTANLNTVDAVQRSFREAHDRAMRQLEQHRFTFTKPPPPKLAPAGQKDTKPAAVAPDTAPPKRAREGRLPADWWDDLWIEIFRQVYLGELKPKSQADLVRAMQQWLSEQDIHAADSTLKPRARKLLKMLKESDG